MHDWGDKGFKYFGDVGEVADQIGNFCKRWGRISVTQTKEKFGTVRVYLSFGIFDSHGLIYPGYVYYQSNILKWIDFKILRTRPFEYVLRILNDWLLFPYQKWIYKLAYKRALKANPHIRKEILSCADWDEYLEGI